MININAGLNPMFDLEGQVATNHALDLPLQQIQTPITGIETPTINVPKIENTSFYQKIQKDKQEALKKGIIKDLFSSDIQSQMKQGAQFGNQLFTTGLDLLLGNKSMQDPTGKYSNEANKLRQQNQIETNQMTQDRIQNNTINDQSYHQFLQQQGPQNSLIPQQRYELNNTTYAEKGVKLNYLNLFR